MTWSRGRPSRWRGGCTRDHNPSTIITFPNTLGSTSRSSAGRWATWTCATCSWSGCHEEAYCKWWRGRRGIWKRASARSSVVIYWRLWCTCTVRARSTGISRLPIFSWAWRTWSSAIWDRAKSSPMVTSCCLPKGAGIHSESESTQPAPTAGGLPKWRTRSSNSLRLTFIQWAVLWWKWQPAPRLRKFPEFTSLKIPRTSILKQGTAEPPWTFHANFPIHVDSSWRPVSPSIPKIVPLLLSCLSIHGSRAFRWCTLCPVHNRRSRESVVVVIIMYIPSPPSMSCIGSGNLNLSDTAR